MRFSHAYRIVRKRLDAWNRSGKPEGLLFSGTQVVPGKKLTMLGNSDIHNPVSWEFDFHNGEHRPMTLVFVKVKTVEALKEALFARRTAVWGIIFLSAKKNI